MTSADLPEDHELVPDPRVVAAVGGRIAGRALELGCGEGRPAVWLACLGWEVTAVDLSPAALERGRRLAAAHGVEVDWVVGDVAEVALPEGLDVVVVRHLHIDPAVLHGALRRAAARLTVGGAVVVVGSDRRSAQQDAGGPVELLYDLDELRATLTGAGLTVVTAERVRRRRGDAARDAVVHAVRR